MIARTLRRFFTSCWLAIASPARNGSTSTRKTLPSCSDESTPGPLRRHDREAMQEALINKYGIKEID